MKKENLKRSLEIIPGFLSWLILFSLVILFLVRPLMAAVVIIVFLLYWVCRLLYMSTLMMMGHHRVMTKKNLDWLAMCRSARSDLMLENIVHIVLYTIYKEPQQVLEDSLNALKDSHYPKDKIIVVLAGEERAQKSGELLMALKNKFAAHFKDILVTIHPKDVPGEIPAKGANATYAARQVKKYLEKEKYNFDHCIISCFDADTCPDKNYLACLAYNFLSNPKRYRTSFQPFPVYSNNVFTAPAFARVIEMGSTFWQLIEGMRHEKFITFSSHSMSFKTLVEVDYWPVDLISDDSLIFWKCFAKYDGDYRTYPLEVPVYMDIAVGKDFIDTIRVQYKQKRRWAWGVENFVFIGMEFVDNNRIPLLEKARRLFYILDNHVSWATWALIVSFITPLTLWWGRATLKDSLVLFNLSYINTIIIHSLSFIIILCIVISGELLPPRPPGISRLVYIPFVLQWALTPFISATLGSLPSLDAQTRLMLGKYLYFFPTPKKRTQR
jgi:cellulose synthase/poly-beta-1,6-N-acetylglucosamine synthase-like glycosyltransferase